ncbi:hypothetical protein J2789_004596 [Variovorax paradoxus]|nr:hypothetical protein [Variovorax paradoxus]
MLLCGCFPRPGLGPAADLLFFASPKKRRQKKGDPAVCVPSLRYGQPAVLDVGGGPQNSLHCVALRQLRPLSLLRLRSSAQPEGSDTRHRFARLWERPGRAFALLGQGFGPRVDFEPVFRLVVLGETLMRSRCARRLSAPGTAGYHQQAPLETTRSDPAIHSKHCRRAAPAVPWRPSAAMARRSAIPSGCAEERSVSRIRARPCLSEASLGETPRNASTAGCPVAQRRGRRQRGRLFFAYFLLAKQKKVGRPPGRVPAPENKHLTTSN